MTLGSGIKYYRKLAGLTQNQLAELTGLKQYTVTKFERDLHYPNPDQIRLLAKALNVSIDMLFGERPVEQKTTEPKKSSREGKLLEAFRKLPASEQRVIVKQAEALSRT